MLHAREAMVTQGEIPLSTRRSFGQGLIPLHWMILKPEDEELELV